MRHHSNKRKFGLEKNQRNALIKSLAYSLIKHERIETTLAKAKELRPYTEKLITRAKQSTLASRRLLISRTGNELGTKKLIETIAPKYKERNGGYIRIIKTGRRIKDGSPMAIIEFV